MGRLPIIHKKERMRRCFTWKSYEASTVLPEQHAFYRQFRFYWIFLKIIGFLPYHIDRDGVIRLKFISKEMAYSVIIYLLLSVPVCLSLRLRWQELFLAGNDFNVKVFTYMMAGLMLPHFSIPCTHWKYLKSHESVFATWHQFQKHYEETFKSKIALHHECWKCYYFLMFLFVGTCAVFYVNYFLIRYNVWWEFIAHLYVMCFFLAHFLVYVEQCASVITLAKDLRKRTIEAVNTRNLSLIGDCNAVWVRLNEVAGLIGFLFYRMYGHLLIIIFSIATMAMYALLCSLISVKEMKLIMWHPIVNIAICKSWIFLFCEFGERVSIQLGYKFSLQLLKLRHLVKDDDIRYEVDDFLSTIRDFPPSISLNGYITVNRRLLITSYSTMVTYLIVVLQFSQEYQPSAPTGRYVNEINSTDEEKPYWQSSPFFISMKSLLGEE